ncbi:MAG: orotidine-5'-phosphate decarboxylase [Desulfobacterales bacterium]
MGSARSAKDYITFGLDLPTFKEAKEYILLLSDYVGMFKVGLELFIECGPDIIRFVQTSGPARIFLDLKLHDIPATVLRAVQRIVEYDVDFATVHCGESKSMLEAAVQGSGGKVGIIGVTVLTSVCGEDIRNSGFKTEFSVNPSELVLKRAAMAKAAGCQGIVCSGLEVKDIKQRFGKDFITITPGIRPGWEDAPRDDQKRVTTPAEAVTNGSDYLVIGRPIRDAKDPRDAAVRIAKEIAAVF